MIQFTDIQFILHDIVANKRYNWSIYDSTGKHQINGWEGIDDPKGSADHLKRTYDAIQGGGYVIIKVDKDPKDRETKEFNTKKFEYFVALNQPDRVEKKEEHISGVQHQQQSNFQDYNKLAVEKTKLELELKYSDLRKDEKIASLELLVKKQQAEIEELEAYIEELEAELDEYEGEGEEEDENEEEDTEEAKHIIIQGIEALSKLPEKLHEPAAKILNKMGAFLPEAGGNSQQKVAGSKQRSGAELESDQDPSAEEEKRQEPENKQIAFSKAQKIELNKWLNIWAQNDAEFVDTIKYVVLSMQDNRQQYDFLKTHLKQTYGKD